MDIVMGVEMWVLGIEILMRESMLFGKLPTFKKLATLM
jgi:hypothetical protein